MVTGLPAGNVDDLFVLSSHDDEHSLYHEFTRNLQAWWEVEDEKETQG